MKLLSNFHKKAATAAPKPKKAAAKKRKSKPKPKMEPDSEPKTFHPTDPEVLPIIV